LVDGLVFPIVNESEEPPKMEGKCRYFSGGGDDPKIMGDKSPKATNKHASQKKAQANTNKQTKSNAVAAKQAVKAKK
jgi:hypothetical protein